MAKYSRDYELAIQIAKLPNDAPIGSSELAAFLGVSIQSIQTGRITNLPPRLNSLGRKMQWRLGDVRKFVRDQTPLASHEVESPQPQQARPRGRPTKTAQIQRGR